MLPTVKGDKKAEFTAKLVQKFSETLIETLKNHPINVKRKKEGKPYTNYVTLRGCGQMLNLLDFKEKFNMRPFMIAPTAIIRGVGITLGIPLLEVKGATGYYDSNLNGKALTAAKAFKSDKFDFGFVHVKSVDDAGHDKDHKIKVEQLEKSDRMIKTFIDEVKGDKERDYIIIITGDHTTPT